MLLLCLKHKNVVAFKAGLRMSVVRTVSTYPKVCFHCCELLQILPPEGTSLQFLCLDRAQVAKLIAMSKTISLYTTFFLVTFSEDCHSLSVQINLSIFCGDLKLSLLMLHSVDTNSLVLDRAGKREEVVLNSLNRYSTAVCQKSRQTSRTFGLISP